MYNMENNINTNTENNSIEDQFHWYSLRVISGKERTVEENINYEAKLNKIDSSKIKHNGAPKMSKLIPRTCIKQDP